MTNLDTHYSSLFPTGSTVIFLHSHPDDESFLNAGIIQFLLKMNYKVGVIYTSAGLHPEIELTLTRQLEAREACKQLGGITPYFLSYLDNIHRIDYPGLTITDSNGTVIVDKILEKARYFDTTHKKPIFVSYDKNGGYGHIDHKALYKSGRLLSQKGYKVIESTMNRDIFLQWIENAKSSALDSKLVPLTSYWDDKPWLPATSLTHSFSLSNEELATKKKALLAHKTQIHTDQFPVGLDDLSYKNVFGTEYLVYAPLAL